MLKLLGSASKVVFILMALASCAGFFMGQLGENNFMILTGAAFTFYFSQKGETGEPFAGK